MSDNNKPKIAILRWEKGMVPKGLIQLEALPGNSTNPNTYPFPVRFVEVPGACAETVITHPDEKVLQSMTQIYKTLEKDGIKLIATSCGFNAVFQQRVAANISIPFFSSSLLLASTIQAAIGKNNTLAVITANKGSLSEKHMRECGITEEINVECFGLEEAKEWKRIFDEPNRKCDMDVVESEIIDTAINAVTGNDKIKAILLECTDLPPFAHKISKATGLMVFDFTTMICFTANSLGEINMYEPSI